MIISLAGYMGSGKSHIAKILSKKLPLELVDLDREIILHEQKPISEIFKQKGEIYLRKIEKKLLEQILLKENNIILSLGGGTPVYHQNMDLINQYSESVYLRTSIPTLTGRLKPQKSHRPLIAGISDENLPEFIAKHLFERNPYYNQCKYIVDTDQKTPDLVAEEIIHRIDFPQLN